MSETTILFLIGQGVVVVGTVIVAAFHLGGKLSKIETDLNWIKRNCPQCQQTLDNPLK